MVVGAYELVKEVLGRRDVFKSVGEERVKKVVKANTGENYNTIPRVVSLSVYCPKPQLISKL